MRLEEALLFEEDDEENEEEAVLLSQRKGVRSSIPVGDMQLEQHRRRDEQKEDHDEDHHKHQTTSRHVESVSSGLSVEIDAEIALLDHDLESIPEEPTEDGTTLALRPTVECAPRARADAAVSCRNAGVVVSGDRSLQIEGSEDSVGAELTHQSDMELWTSSRGGSGGRSSGSSGGGSGGSGGTGSKPRAPWQQPESPPPERSSGNGSGSDNGESPVSVLSSGAGGGGGGAQYVSAVPEEQSSGSVTRDAQPEGGTTTLQNFLSLMESLQNALVFEPIQALTMACSSPRRK